MKKSPLSTPSGPRNNFYRGRGRRRGYGYKQMRNDNDNFYRFSGKNNSPYNQFEENMIPLDSSTPISHYNRGNWRQPTNRRNQRFPNTAISGSCNNQRNNSNNSYSLQKFQRNYQQNNYRQKNEPDWHRKLPISEFMDIQSIFEDPWIDLMNESISPKSREVTSTAVYDSSIEILLEKKGNQNSLSESTSDEATINISSSYEVKEGSSLDLPLDNMNFSRNSKDASISSATTPQKEKFSDNCEKSQNDSVLEILQ